MDICRKGLYAVKNKRRRVLIILLCYFFIVSNISVAVRAANGSSIDNGATSLSDDFEQGRYAVGTGRPVASSTNIRSKTFIAVDQAKSISFNIPTSYTVSVHQYKSTQYTDFITSVTGMKGKTTVKLDSETHYVTFSIKHIDNSAITIDEGSKIIYSWIIEETVGNIQFESGRYAVYTGMPMDSATNIRSKGFIKSEDKDLLLQIPTTYSVSVHQY